MRRHHTCSAPEENKTDQSVAKSKHQKRGRPKADVWAQCLHLLLDLEQQLALEREAAVVVPVASKYGVSRRQPKRQNQEEDEEEEKELEEEDDERNLVCYACVHRGCGQEGVRGQQSATG